jgi:uncharacterized membrane protein
MAFGPPRLSPPVRRARRWCSKASTRQARTRRAGALRFGLVAYGTYDLTNLSTLKDWPPVITVVDMAWGTVLTGTVASASWWIAGLLGLRV